VLIAAVAHVAANGMVAAARPRPSRKRHVLPNPDQLRLPFAVE
jgi:hypothetical protein